jgi:hypothetical protein
MLDRIKYEIKANWTFIWITLAFSVFFLSGQ